MGHRLLADPGALCELLDLAAVRGHEREDLRVVTTTCGRAGAAPGTHPLGIKAAPAAVGGDRANATLKTWKLAKLYCCPQRATAILVLQHIEEQR